MSYSLTGNDLCDARLNLHSCTDDDEDWTVRQQMTADGEKPFDMQILVKDDADLVDRQLDVEFLDTTETLKGMIQHKEGIPTDQQILKFEGNVLVDGATLAAQGITESGAEIELTRILPVRKRPAASNGSGSCKRPAGVGLSRS